jgi:hypothetical protein
MFKHITSILILVLCTFFAGCGGGGSGSTNTNSPAIPFDYSLIAFSMASAS